MYRSQTKRKVTAKTKRLKNLIRKHGSILQNEHKLFDDIIREIVQPQFSAFWFETADRLFEDGPIMIQMPTILIGHAVTRSGFDLQPEHEKEFHLKIDDALLEPIKTD